MPFKCLLCKEQKAFKRKDNLERHIKNIHKKTIEVAKKLSKEAAQEYLAKNSKQISLRPNSNANVALM